jgi:hypothetical protein
MTALSKRRGQILGVALLAIPFAVAGCGESDFQNKPRPPAPLEVTANVTGKSIDIAPSKFGAGLVNLTISNQSDSVVALTFQGGQLDASSDPIEPNSVGNFKLDFPEGTYQVTAGKEANAKPASVRVGPERASSQNQLLLP